MTNYKSFLKIEKNISLPIAVETNVILTPWNDNLFILINSVAKKETFIFKMNDSFTFEKIATLPILSTSAIIFKNKIIVSGSNNDGKPLILVTDIFGKIFQKIPLKITPTIWPVIACSEKIYIVWQEKAKEIKHGILNFNNSEIEKIQSIPVENPTSNLYALSKTILATISEKNKTFLMDLVTNEQHTLNLVHPITVGQEDEAVFYGWTENDSVCIKFLNSKEKYCVASKNANSGKLKAISGNEAALWLQKQEMNINGDYQWKSAIIKKKVEIFEIDNFIHTVGAWNDMLVAVQESKIIFLKKNHFKI
tara:strand:+ start:28637 stop:29560 length:924 start_codon:yes stop_codon:yes gene_type:complete